MEPGINTRKSIRKGRVALAARPQLVEKPELIYNSCYPAGGVRGESGEAPLPFFTEPCDKVLGDSAVSLGARTTAARTGSAVTSAIRRFRTAAGTAASAFSGGASDTLGSAFLRLIDISGGGAAEDHQNDYDDEICHKKISLLCNR